VTRSFNFEIGLAIPKKKKKKKGRKDSGKKEEKINNILYQEQKYLGEGCCQVEKKILLRCKWMVFGRKERGV